MSNLIGQFVKYLIISRLSNAIYVMHKMAPYTIQQRIPVVELCYGNRLSLKNIYKTIWNEHNRPCESNITRIVSMKDQKTKNLHVTR